MTDKQLLARIDRLESIEEIRQLVGKYSLSLDMRDLDAHVNLFAPDIRVSREKSGRANLKAWVDDTLRNQFTGTSHHLGQHIIGRPAAISGAISPESWQFAGTVHRPL